MSHFYKISVIIPAYNAEKTIFSCVDAVLHQQGSGFEMDVIVVDDGSSDATADILKTFERVTCVSQPNSGPAAARNHGARLAKGDILFFTDSDCVPRLDWISTMLPYFDSSEVDVAAGSYGIANPESLLARCVHQEIVYRHDTLMGEWIDVFGGYNVAVRAAVFRAIGGFDEGYRFPSGEDNDLSYRLCQAGRKIRFVKQAKVDHAHPVCVRRYLYEQFRHGYWRAQIYRVYPAMMRGDGYTFWKDSAEIMMAAGMACLIVVSVVRQDFFLPVIALWLWYGFELVFAIKFRLGGWMAALFFAAVMLLRSWARAIGFCIGFFQFFPVVSSRPKNF